MLRELIRKKGYSYSSLAKELGVERSTISKWFTKKTYPRAETALKMSKLLGVTLDLIYSEISGDKN